MKTKAKENKKEMLGKSANTIIKKCARNSRNRKETEEKENINTIGQGDRKEKKTVK